MKDVELYVRYTAMIVALIVARRAPALSSMAGCQAFLFGAGGGRHPSEDMRGATLQTPQDPTSSDRVQVGRQGFVERSCRSDSPMGLRLEAQNREARSIGQTEINV